MTQLGRLYEKEKIEYGNQKAEAATQKITKEFVLKMLEEQYDIVSIMKITGLTEDEIIGLQQEEPATV